MALSVKKDENLKNTLLPNHPFFCYNNLKRCIGKVFALFGENLADKLLDLVVYVENILSIFIFRNKFSFQGLDFVNSTWDGLLKRDYK